MEHPLAFCFIDGGHGANRRGPTFKVGRHTWLVGGWLAIHDVFPDPADGGRPPYEVLCGIGVGEFVSGAWRQPARS